MIKANPPTVISFCDYTGKMVEPWANAGYECWIIDIQHEPGVHREGNIMRVGVDLRRWLPPVDVLARLRIAFAFPPCTDLANSGNRHKRRKGLGRLTESLEFVDRCVQLLEWMQVPYPLENPVGSLKTYWRDPDYLFDPCDYGGYLTPPGDAYTKKTCLWTGGGFVMPETDRVEPVEGSKMHRLPPSPDRANMRSATPMGFAMAVYQANVNELIESEESQ